MKSDPLEKVAGVATKNGHYNEKTFYIEKYHVQIRNERVLFCYQKPNHACFPSFPTDKNENEVRINQGLCN